MVSSVFCVVVAVVVVAEVVVEVAVEPAVVVVVVVVVVAVVPVGTMGAVVVLATTGLQAVSKRQTAKSMVSFFILISYPYFKSI